jgi:hypothetical protein
MKLTGAERQTKTKVEKRKGNKKTEIQKKRKVVNKKKKKLHKRQ